MKVGFDLDGVFVAGPPFVPKGLLEWLHRGPQKNGPHYRFPVLKAEKLIRQLSHTHLLRPKIDKNIRQIYQFLRSHPQDKVYLISSRYGFLKTKTHKILKRYNLLEPFSEIFLNLTDQQPHLFKEEVIKRLKLNIFVDDDLKLLTHLQDTCPKTILLWYNPKSPFSPPQGIYKIKSLKEIDKFLP